VSTEPRAEHDDWSPASNLYSVALSEAQRWREAAQLTAHRMFDGDPYEQQLDARLFLLALRELLYAVDMELKEVERLAPDAHGVLAAARARFEAAVPDLVDARNAIVHFEAYAKGAGRQQKHLQVEGDADPQGLARDFWPFGYDPQAGQIEVGPYQVDVRRSCEEARQLVSAVAAAAREIDAQDADE
jgi:hypothetical protein